MRDVTCVITLSNILKSFKLCIRINLSGKKQAHTGVNFTYSVCIASFVSRLQFSFLRVIFAKFNTA